MYCLMKIIVSVCECASYAHHRMERYVRAGERICECARNGVATARFTSFLVRPMYTSCTIFSMNTWEKKPCIVRLHLSIPTWADSSQSIHDLAYVFIYFFFFCRLFFRAADLCVRSFARESSPDIFNLFPRLLPFDVVARRHNSIPQKTRYQTENWIFVQFVFGWLKQAFQR